MFPSMSCPQPHDFPLEGLHSLEQVDDDRGADLVDLEIALQTQQAREPVNGRGRELTRPGTGRLDDSETDQPDERRLADPEGASTLFVRHPLLCALQQLECRGTDESAQILVHISAGRSAAAEDARLSASCASRS